MQLFLHFSILSELYVMNVSQATLLAASHRLLQKSQRTYMAVQTYVPNTDLTANSEKQHQQDSGNRTEPNGYRRGEVVTFDKEETTRDTVCEHDNHRVKNPT